MPKPLCPPSSAERDFAEANWSRRYPQITIVRGTTPACYTGQVCEREYSNLARTRLKAWGAYQCNAYASQYAITHVGTQADQISCTETWDILDLIIVDHVPYLAVFLRSKISNFIQKFLNIWFTYESVLFIHKNFFIIKKWFWSCTKSRSPQTT